jgi:hypothetical protein
MMEGAVAARAVRWPEAIGTLAFDRLAGIEHIAQTKARLVPEQDALQPNLP